MDPFITSNTLSYNRPPKPILQIPGCRLLVNGRQSSPEFAFVNRPLQDKDKAIKDHWTLWPRAVDLKFVMAVETHPNTKPQTFEMKFVWSWVFKYKNVCDLSSQLNAILITVLFTWGLLHPFLINQRLWDFDLWWSHGFVFHPPQRASNSVDRETLTIACHIGIHVGFSFIQTSLIP